MKYIMFGIAAVAASAIALPAAAQEEGKIAVGVTGGTLGIGPEVSFRPSENFGVRANATFFGLSREVESDGVVYDGSLDLQSFGAMVDVYPFGGGFRISGGARISDNGVGLVATPTGPLEIGDETFTAAEIGILTGEIETNNFAPTLTLGWAGGRSRGVKFGIDAGVMFQGTPEVTQLSATGTLANDADFRAALADERSEIEADIDNFKLYPIVQLSLGYRF